MTSFVILPGMNKYITNIGSANLLYHLDTICQQKLQNNHIHKKGYCRTWLILPMNCSDGKSMGITRAKIDEFIE